MPIDIARRLGSALQVRSETRIRQIDRALTEYVRLTPQSPTLPSPGSIDGSQIVSGFVPDARISESSVTQHEAALAIDWLQLDSVPSTFPPSSHNHNASDLNAGTLADARVAQSNVTQHQAALTLAATQLTSGVLADARVQQSNVTQHEAALDIDWSQLDNVPATFPPADHLTHGTWTPTDQSGAGLAFSSASGSYTLHEDMVLANFIVVYPSTADASAAKISLPFSTALDSSRQQGQLSWSNATIDMFCIVGSNDNKCYFSNRPLGTDVTNAQLSGRIVACQFHYRR